MLVTVLALGAFMLVMAVLVRHVDDIRAHPGRFALEILLVCLGACVPYALIAIMRRASYRRLLFDTALLSVKLAVAWVLFEIAGFNLLLFPARE